MMAISVGQVRDLLLPGLRGHAITYEAIDVALYRAAFDFTPAAPHIWVPKLTVPEIAVATVGGLLIRNPVVTRRFWSGWLS